MFLGERVEGTVPESNAAVDVDGLISALAHCGQQALALTLWGRNRLEIGTRMDADFETQLARGLSEGATHIALWRRVDRVRQQPGSQLVVARRELHGKLATRSLVELGGASGTGTPAGAQTLEAGVEEAFTSQAIEVISGQRSADADSAGSFVASDRPRLVDHEAV